VAGTRDRDPVAPAFRLAAVGDREAVVGLMREYYALDRLAFDPRVARSAVQRLLEDPTLGRVWVCEAAGQAVGYVVLTLGYSLEWGGRDAFVDELYLRAPYRGRGLGRQAMTIVERECRTRRVRALHLEVARRNSAARAFYRRLGFADPDRHLLTRRLAR
jgi:ribosomal protein S18 acetylase RimI-like enzyme